MHYRRMLIEIESPEQLGYDTIVNNLSESSAADQRLSDLGLDLDLDDLLLCYGDHYGHRGLREQIAAEGDGLSAEDVVVTPGAAAALFCVSSSQLDPGEHAVVLRTNYATNIETPRTVGAEVDFVDLRFEDGWELDLDRLDSLVRPETKLISLTYPHNPTGAMLSREDLEAVIDIVERSNAVLLFDETYRCLTHGKPLPMVASLSDRAVSVASLSKAYGMPGLRIGWMACRDVALVDTLLAAKEQIFICGSTLDEAIGAAVLAASDRILPPILQHVEEHCQIVGDWVCDEQFVEWVAPGGGVVCFPRVTREAGIDPTTFHQQLHTDHGTYVGPGHWFDADDHHMRIGYGWPATVELRAGLASISDALHGRKT